MAVAIELTEQQRQAVEAGQGRPVEVVDPVTHRLYLLVAVELYDRVRPLLDEGSPPATQEPSSLIPRGILRAQQAFWRDLPELLKLRSRKRRWVAYQGDERIGFGKTDTELFQECFRRGLRRGEFYVGPLEPREAPPWAGDPIEHSLYEFSAEPLADESGPSA
jgi:hypothetical protein